MKYQVWYMKPDFFRDGICGKHPNPELLSHTHVHLKEVEATNLDDVWRQMQAHNWSPNGEARDLIESKGLTHTSMSVGDVIVDEIGWVAVVASMGFNILNGNWKGSSK